MIDIAHISDQTLSRAIEDGNHEVWEFLALKVMISRFRLKLSMIDANNVQQREEMMQRCCAEMRELFIKCINIPNAKKDMQTIMERFGENG